MPSYLTIALAVWAIISVTCAQSDQLHTYMHPHQALYKLQELESAASQLTDSDIKQIGIISKTLSPTDILRHFTENKAAVSDICSNQTLYMLESIITGGKNDAWALDMIDAWGKPSAGIRRLNLAWLGDFEECQSVMSYYNSSYNSKDSYTVMPESFEAQYCSIGASLGSATSSFALLSKLTIGGCFPSGCSSTDIHTIVANLLNDTMGSKAPGVSVECQEKEMKYSNAAIVTIVLYCIMGAICLAGTLYDFMFIMTAAKPVEESEQGNEHNADTEILISAHKKEEEMRKPGAFGEFLMCFSLYTNGYKLLSTKQAAGSLRCLHGIRFISLMWVILGHTLVVSMGSIGNLLTIFSWFKRWTFQAILNATVSVDSFFVLSALLTSYLFLKELERKKTTPLKFLVSVPIMYLHRYIRLTPAYGFMIMFYTCLLLYTYSSPLKPTDTYYADKFCVTNWWSAIFYFNNVIESSKMCAGWGWYLSNDFQFFLVTPFVVYIMYIVPIGGLILSVAMVLASTGAAAGISVKDDLGIGMLGARDPAHPHPNAQQLKMTDYYYAPWARYQSFGVGVIFGFILWRCRGKLPIPKVANLCLWAVSGAVMLAVLYGPFDVDARNRVASVAEAAMYNGWARTAWSMALGYIMLACCLGRGGWVNEFLSWPAFVPLSRMTYCAYLVHPVIMNVVSASHKNKVMWDEITYIYMFAAYVILSYAVAFLFSLVFEAPFMLIDKKYLTGRLSKSVK